MLTPLPGATPLKPGSATFPFFGVEPAVVDENGKELDGPAAGHLVFKSPWPGMMRTIDGDHDRFEITYFSTFPGYYATGDRKYCTSNSRISQTSLTNYVLSFLSPLKMFNEMMMVIIGYWAEQMICSTYLVIFYPPRRSNLPYPSIELLRKQQLWHFLMKSKDKLYSVMLS